MKITEVLITAGAMLALYGCDQQNNNDPRSVEEVNAITAPNPPQISPTRNAYFGDLHVHTRNSMDAYLFGARTSPDDAYRYAQGESIAHPSGFEIKLDGEPLDFYAVTDHAEYLGVFPAWDRPGTKLAEFPVYEAMKSDNAAVRLGGFVKMLRPQKDGMNLADLNDTEIVASTWAETIEAAEQHNKPGEFTTFSAFEYSATVGGAGMMHRNVIFRDTAAPTVFSSLDSNNPEDLWNWMDQQRENGTDVLAIPHNSNQSLGNSFKLETTNGEAFTPEYADQRMRNEPLVEVTQPKGTSETHPLLSPNDEWANFEILENFMTVSHSEEDLTGNYVRSAYRLGLAIEDKKDFNPFKMGMIGSSDTHVSGGAFTEKNYSGKAGIVDGLALARGSIPEPPETAWIDNAKSKELFKSSRYGASGLTGVWAESNTREAIFNAFRRKETFATTGPRMKVRFFASLNFSDELLNDPNLIDMAYKSGVSMGADLVGDGRAPSFLIWALQDPNSAPLQRAQVIKVTGTDEQVFDVACHTGTPDITTHRCPDNGASVDITSCIATGDGAGELKTMWSDPTFDPSQRASYYVRVLENPSCRWSTWDAVRNNTPPRPDLPATLQERAYTSPIWYAPS